MTQRPADQDPLSVPQAPRRAQTSWNARGPSEVPRRPLGAAEVRTSAWAEVASLDTVAHLTPADGPTEDTPSTVFPGSYEFDIIALRDDSTTDATAIPDDELDAKLREQLERMSAQHIITLDDGDDEPEAAHASSKPFIESVSTSSLRQTPDFRSMARTPDIDFDAKDGEDSALTWVLVGALVASASVLVAGWMVGLI